MPWSPFFALAFVWLVVADKVTGGAISGAMDKSDKRKVDKEFDRIERR